MQEKYSSRGLTPRRESLVERSKGDGGNAFEFSAIMIQSGQSSHTLDGRHKELRQSHRVLFRSDFAPCLSIYERRDEDRLDLSLVIPQESFYLDVVNSSAQIRVHQEAATLVLRFAFA